jgi:hypothetical protein
VQSHEVGIEDGQPFIAMEYLDGQSLGRILHRDKHSQTRALPLDKMLFVFCELLEGLEYAHTLTDYDGTHLNIVHRDVSPENVFVTYSGQVKIVDFGIAKSLESNKTRVGVVKGKVAYMAPEQILGTGVDGRTDLFAVGVMLWQAVAGRPMHTDLSSYEICERVVRGGLPSIREAAHEVPDPLARIVERALATKREDRYPDAATFRRELSDFMGPNVSLRPRELGERIAQAFSVERKEISAIIRRGMAGLPTDPLSPQGPATRVITPARGSGPGSGPGSSPRGAPPFEGAQTSPMHERTPQKALTTPVVPPLRKRSSWLGMSAMVLVALGLSFWWLTGRPTPELDGDAVSVNIRATPAEAMIVLDQRLLENPYRGLHPRDGREHVLQVRAQGFVSDERVVRFDRDLEVAVALSELPRALTPPAPIAPAAQAPAEAQSTPASAARPSEAPSESKREAKRRPNRQDAYRDLTPRKPNQLRAPTLDKEDPWAP